MTESIRKLLQVHGQGITAEAVFVRIDGMWVIPMVGSRYNCSPSMSWMAGKTMPEIAERLRNKGLTWAWDDCAADYDCGMALWERSVDGAVKAEKRQAAMQRNRRKKQEWSV